MFNRLCSKYAGWDFLLPIFKELRILNNCQYIVWYLRTLNSYLIFTLESIFVLSTNILSDGNTQKMPHTRLLASDCFHVHNLKQFQFIHESVQWVSPTLSYCLKIFYLLYRNIQYFELGEFLHFFFGNIILNEWSYNSSSGWKLSLLNFEKLVLHLSLVHHLIKLWWLGSSHTPVHYWHLPHH